MALASAASETKLNQLLKIDVQNEKVAIGHMLQDEQSAINANRMLQEKYFVTPYASRVFKIVKSCVDEARSVSDIHFKISSIADEDWHKVDSNLDIEREEYITDYLTQAVAFIGSSVVAEGVFKKIQEQYLRRQMFTEYQEAMVQVLETSNANDLQSIVNNISNKSNAVLDGMIVGEEESYKEQGLKVLNQKEQESISTGFSSLDDIIDGFRAGQLITIGAGTGVGKSAFAINLALNITKQGYKVGFWSFEMDEEEIFQRIFSNKSGFYRKGRGQEERYNASRKYIDNTDDNIQIHTDPIKDLGNFYLQCRRLSLQDGMRIVVIDYLQLIHLKQDFGVNRVAEIEIITQTLKNMASELGITIIILSQLSRAYQRRDDKTPVLSDLRDSGSIEQDSNIVIFLNRIEDKPTHYQKWEHSIEIIVAKNRSGKNGKFFTKYNGGLTTFTEINN